MSENPTRCTCETLVATESDNIEIPHLHLYKVGIMSHAAFVEAPSALAAAVFYGAATSGNMLFGAAVYEEDGHPYIGSKPWLRWQFGLDSDGPSDAQIAEIKRSIKYCRFVTAPPALEKGELP